MKKLFFAPMVAAAMLLSTSAFAQFNVGGGLFGNKYGGGYGKMHAGLQLRLGYDVKEGKAGVEGGINFSPMKGKTPTDDVYMDNSGSYQSVPYTQSVGMQNIFIHAHYRFGAPENAFHFKIFGGASFDMISVKYSIAGTAPTGYTRSEYLTDESTTGPKVDLGIGGDYRMGPGDFFGEIELGLPANKVNDQAYDNPTVVHYGIAVGYKFYFGSRDGGY